uniref:Uncharacterized protein n=1 Tax=Arundo donax TaxID=35708 RepID=A0A0A9GJU6_ARUDO
MSMNNAQCAFKCKMKRKLSQDTSRYRGYINMKRLCFSSVVRTGEPSLQAAVGEQGRNNSHSGKEDLC